MRAYFFNIWDTVRASYWLVPTLFAIASLIVSLVMPAVDRAFGGAGQLPNWILTTTETARTTLSAVFGAMFAVTGTVFSITIVALSVTSQQFGPRLLRGFMYDLPTQITLGAFLATGAYCLLILRVVEGGHGLSTPPPHLSVGLGVGFAIACMAILIGFVHHVAVLIQAPHVVASVAEELDDAIDRLFPDKNGDVSRDEHAAESELRAQQDRFSGDSLEIVSGCEGYIQAIDLDGMTCQARKQDLVIRLLRRPGDFITIDAPLAEIWSGTSLEDGESGRAALTRDLNERIIVGIRRTPRQDVGCAIEELVEVAVRSLSPGINDPFTAISCIDRLSASLGRIAQRRMPAPYRSDEDGRIRILLKPVAFETILDAAFDQIRQHGRCNVPVSLRLLEAMGCMAKHVTRAGDRTALRRHAERVLRHRESLHEEDDRLELSTRFDALVKTLNG